MLSRAVSRPTSSCWIRCCTCWKSCTRTLLAKSSTNTVADESKGMTCPAESSAGGNDDEVRVLLSIGVQPALNWRPVGCVKSVCHCGAALEATTTNLHRDVRIVTNHVRNRQPPSTSVQLEILLNDDFISDNRRGMNRKQWEGNAFRTS